MMDYFNEHSFYVTPNSKKIKFKLYDKITKQMLTQENIHNIINNYEHDEYNSIYEPYYSDEWYPAFTILSAFDYLQDIIENPRFKVMELTGLYDGKGKEIYENDIVVIKLPYKTYHAYILWGDCGWEMQCIENKELCWHLSKSFDLEIIGNIFENPELLGEQQ